MTAQTRRNFLKQLAGIASAVALPNLETIAQTSQPTTRPASQPAPTTRPASYKTSDFNKDTDEVLLARMLFGETRDCTTEEKVAVAYSAINRINDGKKWNGETLKEVILKPYQYSCFNKNDPNRKKLMDPERYEPGAFQDCLEISRQVLSKRYQDPTSGATHYFNPKVVKPTWAKKMKKIGFIKTAKGRSQHEFYRKN